jgi:hypothetical protein
MDQVDKELYDIRVHLGVPEKEIELIKESRLKSTIETECTCDERVSFILDKTCGRKIFYRWKCALHGICNFRTMQCP